MRNRSSVESSKQYPVLNDVGVDVVDFVGFFVAGFDVVGFFVVVFSVVGLDSGQGVAAHQSRLCSLGQPEK